MNGTVWRWGGLAGVQRTRIGYGNEGRTKQLAASLSDFIRLFSLYYPASPNNATQHTKSLLLHAQHSGGSSTLQLGTSALSPSFYETHRLAKCRRFAVPFLSLVFIAPIFMIPLLPQNFSKSLLIVSRLTCPTFWWDNFFSVPRLNMHHLFNWIVHDSSEVIFTVSEMFRGVKLFSWWTSFQ